MIGRTLLHYKLVEQIGRGGMGVVYRARDEKLGRDVALKLLPTDFTSDPERLRRFEREARLLASLSHPKIATIHGFEQDGEHRFLVLELVEGDNLPDMLAAGVSTESALSLACQIAEGMEAAHARGIIHRDLKPANIKLTPDGKVKILDFGLARASEAAIPEEDIENSPTITADHTREGTLLGTAPYMSPEQLRARGIDQRTDIWAFGCVLYEMLTGTSPFRAESSPEIMARILEHEPDWDALPSDLPPPVARLLRRCLAKEPRQRLHSAADIRIVLQEILDGDVETPAAVESAPRTATRRTAAVAVATFVLGALLAGLVTRRGTPDDAAQDPVRLMIPVRDETAVVPMPDAPSVAISPDGRTVVYVASYGSGPGVASLRPNTRLYRRPIDSFESTPIRGTVGASSPFFSPDGRWVGFMHIDSGTMKRVALAGGAPLDITFVPEQMFRGADWSDDGVIYYSEGGGLWAVDEGGGERRLVVAPDLEAGEKTYRCPNVLPGGDALLCMFGSSDILTYDDADIVLLDLESGERRVLARGGLDPLYVPTGHVVFGRGGQAFALPFDLDRREVTGPPVMVVDRVVTSDGYGSLQLSCSDNGTLVYVAGGPEQFASQLMILHLDGRIDPIPQPPRPYGSVYLSRDAVRFVVSILGANASLWIYDLRRDTMTKLVSGWDNFAPVWNQSGETIAFGSSRGGDNALWITPADGSGEVTKLFDRSASAYPTCWSPDGRWLVAHMLSPTTGLDIWMIDRDGEGTPIVQSRASEIRGQISPDGRYIAYASDESGRLEIYVRTFPDPGRKWKLSEDGGDLPMWSPDGSSIYYWNGRRLMMVPVDLQPRFEPARARQVLETAVDVNDYQIFPDGERFLVVGRTTNDRQAAISVTRPLGRLFSAESPDLHVVLNWFDDLIRLTSEQ
jgi:WD40 repeat protein